MKGNEIPKWARQLTEERDKGRCVMCGAPGTNHHHRRSRSVRDEHRHCTCVLVTLCGSGTTGCHGYVHARPLEARGVGLIVSKFTLAPRLIPFRSRSEWVFPDCAGGEIRVTADDMEAATVKFKAVDLEGDE